MSFKGSTAEEIARDQQRSQQEKKIDMEWEEIFEPSVPTYPRECLSQVNHSELLRFFDQTIHGANVVRVASPVEQLWPKIRDVLFDPLSDDAKKQMQKEYDNFYLSSDPAYQSELAKYVTERAISEEMKAKRKEAERWITLTGEYPEEFNDIMTKKVSTPIPLYNRAEYNLHQHCALELFGDFLQKDATGTITLNNNTPKWSDPKNPLKIGSNIKPTPRSTVFNKFCAPYITETPENILSKADRIVNGKDIVVIDDSMPMATVWKGLKQVTTQHPKQLREELEKNESEIKDYARDALGEEKIPSLDEVNALPTTTRIVLRPLVLEHKALTKAIANLNKSLQPSIDATTKAIDEITKNIDNASESEKKSLLDRKMVLENKLQKLQNEGENGLDKCAIYHFGDYVKHDKYRPILIQGIPVGWINPQTPLETITSKPDSVSLEYAQNIIARHRSGERVSKEEIDAAAFYLIKSKTSGINKISGRLLPSLLAEGKDYKNWYTENKISRKDPDSPLVFTFDSFSIPIIDVNDQKINIQPFVLETSKKRKKRSLSIFDEVVRKFDDDWVQSFMQDYRSRMSELSAIQDRSRSMAFSTAVKEFSTELQNKLNTLPNALCPADKLNKYSAINSPSENIREHHFSFSGRVCNPNSRNQHEIHVKPLYEPWIGNGGNRILDTKAIISQFVSEDESIRAIQGENITADVSRFSTPKSIGLYEQIYRADSVPLKIEIATGMHSFIHPELSKGAFSSISEANYTFNKDLIKTLKTDDFEKTYDTCILSELAKEFSEPYKIGSLPTLHLGAVKVRSAKNDYTKADEGTFTTVWFSKGNKSGHFFNTKKNRLTDQSNLDQTINFFEKIMNVQQRLQNRCLP